MNNIEQLTHERAHGDRAQRAYNEFIKDFIQERKDVCFEAFKLTPILEVESILETKRLLMAIEALDGYIQEIINTGKLASTSLKNEELH